MKCPSDKMTELRCNQILDAAAVLVEQQGIVSFKFSQLAKEVGCSTGTLYRFFEGKEDVLVCLFLRNATSNHFLLFTELHPHITAQQKLLLPVVFTFETIKRNNTFFTLRSVSVNKLVWQLASEEKIARFKRRINAFWSWFHCSLALAIEEGELQATEKELDELTQAIVFFLTGALTQFEGELIEPKLLGERRETCYRHLSLIMQRYKWKTPLTRILFEELTQATVEFFNTHVKTHGSCTSCSAQDACLRLQAEA